MKITKICETICGTSRTPCLRVAFEEAGVTAEKNISVHGRLEAQVHNLKRFDAFLEAFKYYLYKAAREAGKDIYQITTGDYRNFKDTPQAPDLINQIKDIDGFGVIKSYHLNNKHLKKA